MEGRRRNSGNIDKYQLRGSQLTGLKQKKMEGKNKVHPIMQHSTVDEFRIK